MKSFLFALNAVLPIILMVGVGYVIKRLGLITPEIAKGANKLVFRLFLPCLLFLNVYKISSVGEVGIGYIVYIIIAEIIIFAASIPLIMLLTKDSGRRGPTLQCVFRSNFALIGIPLAISLYGDAGGAVAALLSAVAIPTFNVLAVISLTMFKDGDKRIDVKRILFGIVKNPLIQAIALGGVALLFRALFVRVGIDWRLTDLTPIYKVLESMSQVATPLALVVLGAQFEFSAIPGYKREIIFAVLARVLVVPIIILGVALAFFSFDGAHYAAILALAATPVAVSSVPMSQEFGQDSALAGQFVVWTTILSSVTLFGFILVMNLLGVF